MPEAAITTVPLVAESDPQRVIATCRLVAACVLARRLGPVPGPIARALRELERREPEWMARLECRAADLIDRKVP